MTASCPACGEPGASVFYNAGDLPVHSTLLMASREQALAFPRRPLELAWCRRCGFIFNHLFDPSVHVYSGQCEESQGCSPTFRRWLEGLVDALVEQQGIRDRRVLEIGCGKGEFLALLCAEGNNAGIGYDPAWVPARGQAACGRGVQVHQRLWNRACGIHAADVIACRHTLEHIGPAAGFLCDLRAAIGAAQPLLLFDVPDTARVLAEGAFWDIYYEHCSYFTAGSLQRLFQRCGFAVQEQWTDYDKQFLMLTARPAADCAGEESPPAGLGEAIVAFQQAADRQTSHWADLLAGAAARQERVVVWGGGSKASAFLNRVPGAAQVGCVVDINPHKQGFFIPGSGHPVVGPGALAAQVPRHVILMNPVYRAEVTQQLADLGMRAQVHALGALPGAAI